MLDIRKTPEIYPMTSMQETLEYFHDKLNETTAAMQRLAEQVQQLRSPKTKKPVQEAVRELDAELESDAEAEQRIDDLLERIRQPQEDVVPVRAPEPGPPAQADKSDVLSIMYRRFSEQQLLPEPLWARLQGKFGAGQEAECKAEPEAECKAEPEAAPESVQAPSKPPRVASDLHVTNGRLKRPSLCMLPPDDMQDIMQAISPQVSSVPASPLAPAPSPDTDAPVDRSLGLFEKA